MIMPKKIAHVEHHVQQGGYIREVIYGFNDGIVSNFALIAGMAGAAVQNTIVVLVGLAGLVAGSISMGLGAYISTKSENEYYKNETEVEKWEIENMPEKEKEELIDIMERWGFKGKDLNDIVKHFFKNKKAQLKVMLSEEIGVPPEEKPAWVVGLTTFGVFVIGAILPVIPFLFVENVPSALKLSAIFSLLCIFTVGGMKTLITGKSWWKSGA